MYHWIRPDVAIPVHGEPRHLTAHAKLAKECQVPEALTALNGSLVRLAPGRAEVIDEVFVGRLALDGNRLIDLDSPAIRDRRRMIQHGTAVATVVRSEEHTSELQSLMRISYAVFCLKKKKQVNQNNK